MSVHRPKYRVYLAGSMPGNSEEHEVTVTYADQLRGELEANKQGLPPMSRATAQNHTAVWVWCALVRLGLYGNDCQTFLRQDALDVEPMDADGAAEAVDPTPAAPSSEPPSSLPTTSAAVPGIGWTPS